MASTDHLRGVAEIRPDQIRKLERAGIATMAALAAWSATPGEIAAWERADLAHAERKGPHTTATKGKRKLQPAIPSLPQPAPPARPGLPPGPRRVEGGARQAGQSRYEWFAGT